MATNLYNTMYNPDVLSCIANLSNDEVFTPPEVANAMLDLLPQELFSDPNTTFLDPACKSGVFLREIAKRLLKGLEPLYPDLQERTDHIFKHQLYGIAITELTSHLSRRSLYCSKFANGRYSVSQFDTIDGNVRFKRINHTWGKTTYDIKGKPHTSCVFCGANKEQYDRGLQLETHAYEMIHTTKPEEILNMKFDVIISNPPYQLSDGGNGASATPIYHLFIQQAKKLSPRFLSMIVPSRWFAGGKGLDSFRKEMIEDTRIRVLHDFLNASDCFGTGVEIKGGVCYFLWDRDNCGKCLVATHDSSGIISKQERYMKIGDNDVFVRRNEAISILDKVASHGESSFSKLVSTRRPFGLATSVVGNKTRREGDAVLFQRGGESFYPIKQLERNVDWVNKYKIFISKAYNAGDDYPHQIINKPVFGDKGTCCTETYIVIGPFDDEIITKNVISYINTKFFRFFVSLKKISQDATQRVYGFVPMQDFSKPWTDEELYKKYGLTEEEIAFIDSMIKPMDLGGDE